MMGGEMVWGQTHVDRAGRVGLRMARGKEAWVVKPVHELQIVPDDLRNAVQERLKVMTETIAVPTLLE